jgi:signal transduction histidine kinase
VAELRQIAHGLRPSSLDDGLAPALENLTRSSALPLRLTFDADELPEHVSVTAYYVASEGVANAVKHSGAREVEVAVRRDRGNVLVAVRDDGSGGARITPGSGLSMLCDRVHALGGRLSLHSPPLGGTVMTAEIPCGS